MTESEEEMTIKDGVKYASIFVFGAVSGVLVSKGYFEKKANEDIESVKESLRTMIHLPRPEKEEKSADDISVKRPADPRKTEMVVDYSGYSKVVKQYTDDPDPAESESPSEDDIPEDVENYLDGKRDSEEPRREPRLIKYEDFGELPYYDKITLLYYMDDEVLTTEDDEIVPNPEELLGDSLTRFGFNKNDERVIFVRNEKRNTDYEIDKVFAAYAKEDLDV
jgi:hypothetical protein